MKLLSWNCQGLGNPWTVQDLCHMVKEKKPDILFLMETKCRKEKLESIRVRMGFIGMFVVEPVGRSGGLVLFWKNVHEVEIQNYTRHHINAMIKANDSSRAWKLTCFYGHPVTAKRHESWALLQHLRQFQPQPWLCIGDFNEILTQDEKTGAILRREGQMDQFRNALGYCQLTDLGFIGSQYTWTNCRHDGNFVKERLDRAVANIEWRGIYREANVFILAARASDHKPVMLQFSQEKEEMLEFYKSFKFEAKWQLDEEFGGLVEETWNRGVDGTSGLQMVQHKLAACQRSFTRWSCRKYGNAEKTIKKKTKELEALQLHEGPENWGDISRIKSEIESIMEQEDVKWKQRAKQNWYKNGDRNTPFFHAWADHRRRVNYIGRIVDEGGRTWNKKKEIPKVFIDFYQQLFTSEGTQGVDDCLSSLEPRVTSGMNEELLRNFTMEDIDTALSQMHPLKSPGPDGFSACFYQRSWATIRLDVGKAVLDFLNFGVFDPSLNSTHIVLIPKIKNPTRITDYRPISLCNVLYKLMSKVLANRMKGMLNSIISPNQSAFLPGRLITDNVIVAFEALHSMNNRFKGRKGFMALKLDMSKAYDRVEWDFLELLMRKIGFAERWVDLIMTCVRTVSYSILINGRPYGHIRPTRGIRQGDPLSPYLFILCAEGLSTLLHKAERDGTVTGLPIAKGGTKINHLFFADDSLLFCRANFMEWGNIQGILDTYEKASGQKLNREKTSIFFSKNTKAEFREYIASISGVRITNQFEKYLGLPAVVGQSRMRAFGGLKGRIWERMQGWQENFLSQAGKEVLLKAVVQAIPTYTMSVFQLPKTLCKEINSVMSKFWWGHKNDDNKVAWMSWSKIGWSKERGGLGFRDLEWFNLALLAKQGWRIIKNPDSLSSKILKEKYFPHTSFLDAHLGRQPSFIWRSFWNARCLLEAGLVWRVGDGKNIGIWTDRWVPAAPGGFLQSPVQVLDRDAKVSELLDTTTNWWNMSLIRDIFSVEEADLIGRQAVSPRSGMDRLVWSHTKNGEFTVRSAYHLAKDKFEVDRGSCSNRDNNRTLWKAIWNIDVPRAAKIFLWKACSGILPTKENLYSKKITPDPLCPICQLEVETTAHALWSCPSAQDVWSECPNRIQKSSCEAKEFLCIMQWLLNKCTEEEIQLVILVARQIWHRRNSLIFGGSFSSPSVLLRVAKDQYDVFSMVAKQNGRQSTSPIVKTVIPWQKPPGDTIKINWDAAVDGRRRRIGMGAIVRDSEGLIVAMMCDTMDCIQDPATAEALAARRAIELGLSLGIRRIVLEGDSLQVVHALQMSNGGGFSYGPIIEDAQQLSRRFLEYTVRYVQREANGEAHRLAKLALSREGYMVWRENFPLS
jgi:exonuclease III/ribonuclease HI